MIISEKLLIADFHSCINKIKLYCEQNKKCLFLTTVSKEQVISELLKIVSGVNIDKKIITNEDIINLTNTIEKISKWKIIVHNFEPNNNKADIEQLVQKYLPDYLLIDEVFGISK